VVSAIDVRDPALMNKIKAFAKDPNGGPGGLIVPASTTAAVLRKTIINTAQTNKLPAIFPNRLYCVDGGLISLGADLSDLYLSGGLYAKQILMGTKPSPVIDTTQTGSAAKFEMVINLKAAAAINLTVDPALLAKADLVIR
jgi:putative ABC transport system substrate-binding protein